MYPPTEHQRAIARLLVAPPAKLHAEAVDTAGQPVTMDLKLHAKPITAPHVEQLTDNDLRSIKYVQITTGSMLPSHVIDLATLLHTCDVRVTDSEAMSDFTIEAFSEEFDDVELLYLGPGDDLSEHTDVIEAFINLVTPSENDAYDNLHSTLVETIYNNAYDEAHRILDHAIETLDAVGIETESHDHDAVREQLMGADQNDYVALMAKATRPVFIQGELCIDDATQTSTLSLPELPDHLNHASKAACEKVWAMSELSRRGVQPTDHNVAMLIEALNNFSDDAWIELSVFARVELTSFVDSTYHDEFVTIERPLLWVGDLSEGYGIETDQIDGSITVRRSTLHHHEHHPQQHSVVETNGFSEHAFDVCDVTFPPQINTAPPVTDED